MNLRNRTGEERRRQTLCDKRDNNFFLKKPFAKLHISKTDLFVEEQKKLMLSEFPTKHASNSPVTFAAFKRFAVLSRKLTNELMLAERVWYTKSQSSLLNIYFRLSGLQSLHIHFR